MMVPQNKCCINFISFIILDTKSGSSLTPAECSASPHSLENGHARMYSGIHTYLQINNSKEIE